MKVKQLKFSHDYTKLKKPVFTTVRWLDSEYTLGKIYKVYRNKTMLGKARLIRMQITNLSYLTDEFIVNDADCDRNSFYKLMESWYHRKPDWLGLDSEIQVLTFEWISKNPEKGTVEKLAGSLRKKFPETNNITDEELEEMNK